MGPSPSSLIFTTPFGETTVNPPQGYNLTLIYRIMKNGTVRCPPEHFCISQGNTSINKYLNLPYLHYKYCHMPPKRPLMGRSKSDAKRMAVYKSIETQEQTQAQLEDQRARQAASGLGWVSMHKTHSLLVSWDYITDTGLGWGSTCKTRRLQVSWDYRADTGSSWGSTRKPSSLQGSKLGILRR